MYIAIRSNVDSPPLTYFFYISRKSETENVGNENFDASAPNRTTITRVQKSQSH